MVRSTYKMSVSIPQDLVDFYNSKVADHTFGSFSHAVTLALSEMKERMK